MATFDLNNNLRGSEFGHDRIGHTTPDSEASEVLRPFMPVPYPAPYLPTKRSDQGHPVLASVVLTAQELVGVDVSGAIVPVGLFCGVQPAQGKSTVTGLVVASGFLTVTAANAYEAGDQVSVIVTGAHASLSSTYTVVSATTTTFTVATSSADFAEVAAGGTSVLTSSGSYCAIKYTQADTNFGYNAITGNRVQAAGEVAVLAAPSDAANGDVITFADGTTYAVTANDITAAKACTLFPSGTVKPLGLTIRNAFQYIGGVAVTTTTGGMRYQLDGVVPIGFPILNYKYEMGIPIQTEMVIRVPWLGAEENTLAAYAAQDGIAGYVQGYGRSFIHFVGQPLPGLSVVGARGGDVCGNYAPYDPSANSFNDITGRILAVQNMYPIRDYANRVRTLFNPDRLLGPIKDPNPASMQMGGSATAGMPYQMNLTTDGIFKKAYDQGKTLRPEYSTYVYLMIRTF